MSPLFWLNTFGWTYKKMEYGETGNIRNQSPNFPFITWNIQDRYITKLVECIKNGRSLLTDKSRDMGASWCLISALHYAWQFWNNMDILELSRIEEDVDGPGKKGELLQSNISTLFGKHDYLHLWQPSWLRPRRERTTLHIVNMDNGSRIDGQSSNANAGTSQRRDAVLIDEMAKMEQGDDIKQSLMDVAPCLLPNSTPKGAGTAFSKWRLSGKIEVFVLPWWEHPDKGKGRYVEQDPITGKYQIKSPWYCNEETRRSKKEISEELDMNHLGSGDTVFDSMEVERHIALHARKPRSKFNLEFEKSTTREDITKMLVLKNHTRVTRLHRPKGQWRMWDNIISGRPDQTVDYIFGVDISKGLGASNSVISVTCKQTREKIAEYADANTPPHDLAWAVCSAALWFGGKNGIPLVIYESNGEAGVAFGRELCKILQYPSVYIDKAIGTIDEKQSKNYGWHSNRDKKAMLLSNYSRALAHNGFINHSEEALVEAMSYIYYENGGIGPAELIKESDSARQTHGDRVIADALSLIGCDGKLREEEQIVNIPIYSYAARQKARQRLDTLKKNSLSHKWKAIS
jgi:hypothetical protein